MTQDNDDTTDDEPWFEWYLKNTVDEMIAEGGMDPDKATVTDAEYADGELRIAAIENPHPDAILAEAKAVAEWVEGGGGSFIETKHGDAIAAVYDDDGQMMVETEVNGESVGEPMPVDESTAQLVAAARHLD